MTREDWISIAIGGGLAVSGALIAYAADVVIPALQATGNASSLMIAAAASVGINILRKWMASRVTDN